MVLSFAVYDFHGIESGWGYLPTPFTALPVAAETGNANTWHIYRLRISGIEGRSYGGGVLS
jgi:hypothetical protein